MRKLMLGLAATSLTVPVLPATAAAHEGYSGKVWRDSQGRLRCQRPNGTTGLLVGGAGARLIGRAVHATGDRATGTILGAAAGALMGRRIDRSRVHCR